MMANNANLTNNNHSLKDSSFDDENEESKTYGDESQSESDNDE